MAITTMLAFVYARHAWRWSPLRATVVFGCFLALDLTFLSANLLKSRWRMVSDLGSGSCVRGHVHLVAGTQAPR
jgi:hypothetical protein